MKQKLTYREIVREFLSFLKKENVYRDYIEAIKQQKRREFIHWENYVNVFTIYSLKRCFKSDSGMGNLIDDSFHWASTKEGHNFWSALNKKWYDKMKDTEIVAEKLTNN